MCVNHFRKAICSNSVTRKRAIKSRSSTRVWRAFTVSSVLSGTESDSMLTESIKLDIMSLRRTLFFVFFFFFEQNICTHRHGMVLISECLDHVCMRECIRLSSTRCTFFFEFVFSFHSFAFGFLPAANTISFGKSFLTHSLL